MKSKKIISIIFIIIFVINIVFLVYGYLSDLNSFHSFNESFSDSIYNITRCVIVLLLLQIYGIVLLIISLKKNVQRKRWKIIVFRVVVIIIFTMIVPVKEIHGIKYKPVEDNIIKKVTIYENTYKNLYGFTIHYKESSTNGVVYY